MRPSVRSIRFVLNADDLGASAGINDAIFSAIADGLISSATVMATGPAFDAAICNARTIREASFGVHMNLTEHRPLARSPGLAPLLDSNGAFRHGEVFRIRGTPRLINAAVAELTAQVRAVQAAGLAVSHLDSHHHIHTVPWMFIVLKRVQRETGIRRVRGTWSIYDRQSRPSLTARSKKRAWWWALRHVYRTVTTSEFSDFLIFRRALAEGSYPTRGWPESIELMLHPTGDARDAEEARALRDGWVDALPIPAKLVTYRDL